MSTRLLRLTAATLGGSLLLSGCANQLPQRSDQEARSERKLLEHSLSIDVGEPATLELPQQRIRIQEQKTFAAVSYTHLTLPTKRIV